MGYLSDIINVEMPLEPNLEELCENSGLIICGEPNDWIQIEDTVEVIAFKVHKVYKGQTNQKCINIIIPKVNKGKTKLILSIKGIKSTYMTMGCSVIPIYVKDKKYFLFLDQKKTGSCYVRAKLDDVWGQRDWNKEQEQQLIDEIKFLSDPNKWKILGDNISYTIPKGAEEKIVPLTEYQKENNFSKRAEYWLNGELVGERAWYGNGQIAYEQPIKDSMQHGNYKAWYQDGKLRAVCPYRKDRLHGVFKQWSNKGHLEITYWVRGKDVTRKDYLKELKNNATLPLIEK